MSSELRGCPAEPFIVKHYTGDEFPSIKGNGFDGLRVGDDCEEADEFINFINSNMSCAQTALSDDEWLSLAKHLVDTKWAKEDDASAEIAAAGRQWLAERSGANGQ